MILAGDIGGTKIELALFDPENPARGPLETARFSSRDYPDFDTLLTAFGERTELRKIHAVGLGVAGPVENGRCRTTNLPWHLDTLTLKRRFQTGNVLLLNDLEAAAYGMLSLEDDAFEELNPSAAPAGANRAVIAAGTGLGEAVILHDDGLFRPVPTEGGHCDFAPATPRQERLLSWLRKRFPDHVSYERVLSGEGIFLLYRFLIEEGYAADTAVTDGTADPAALIARAAMEKNDPLSRETLELFCEIYGAEAGNLALKCLARGGVYLGGGIAPKILPLLRSGTFMKAFVSKGRFAPVMEKISVRVCTAVNAALTGAAVAAAKRFRDGSTSVR